MREVIIALSAITLSSCAVDRSGFAYAVPRDADSGRIEDAAADVLRFDSPPNDVTVTPDAWEIPDTSDDTGETGIPDADLPDTAAADASLDASADAELPDAGPEDAGPSDAGSDAGPADPDAGSDDAGPEDGGPPDGGPPDAGPEDAGPADAGSDAEPPLGCADDSIEQRYPVDPGTGDLVMVGCNGAATQCEAEVLCAPGWRLCAYAAYRARGGDAIPATAQRWMAGCMRESCGDVIGPGAAVCTSCGPTAGATADLSFQCGGTEPARREDDCNVGIAAGPDPWHLVSRSLPCVYASAEPAATPAGATCCR